MTENERITYQLVNSLSQAVKNGINASTIADNVYDMAKQMDCSEQQPFLKNVFNLSVALSQAAVEGIQTISQQRVDAMVDSIVLLNQQKQQCAETAVPKKQVYSASEVLELLPIKKKETLIKYFNNGTIKATQNETGRWFVKREDLAKYMGTDNF